MIQMSKTAPSPKSSPSPEQSSTRPFLMLGIVFGVAAVLSVLFTGWTPGQFFEQNDGLPNSNSIPVPYQSKDTAPPPGSPTDTMRPGTVIGIVAGHWGNDSGAVCNDGLQEVDINLNIASLVQKGLAEKGYIVDLLQEFDSRLAGYRAAALISIHADSCDYVNDLATGYKVAAALGSHRPERSARLTACMRSRYTQFTGLPLHSTSVTLDMTSYHAFGEVDINTPAAIIETGFMNLDRQFLTQTPELAAQGIVSGILCFINNESVSQATSQPLPTNTP
jgi:N-acetylmuramoyl-L-alanine amidase